VISPADARALLERAYAGGTTVTNCVVHTHLDLTERPDDCNLCRADLRNAFCRAGVVNEWLNDWKADAEKLLEPIAASDHLVALDDYEVANLLQALRFLQRIGCDTGDWLGQIRMKLPEATPQPANVADDELLRRVTRAKDVREALGVDGDAAVLDVWPEPVAEWSEDPRRRLFVLVSSVTERHFVDLADVKRECGEPLEGETWDDFLIRVFERFDGSVYGDELFPSDANPQVGIEIEAHDPEA